MPAPTTVERPWEPAGLRRFVLLGESAELGKADFVSAPRHYVEGLLVGSLAEGSPESDAIDLGARWRERQDWVVRLDLEVGRIGRALSENPAPHPPIILKGPAVSRFYSDPSVRTYLDIDLMVPDEDIPWWERFFERLGYAGPSPWHRRWDQFFRHTEMRRSVHRGSICMELHGSLLIARAAKKVDYFALLAATEDSRWPQLRWPQRHALVLVLALHLLHHPIESRRLIWLRDLVELCDEETLVRARSFARSLDVLWAIDLALNQIPELFPPTNTSAPRGMVPVLMREHRGLGFYRAMIYELGWRQWFAFMGTSLDPRRFADGSGRVDWTEVRAWTRRQMAVLSARRRQ